ncbi:hypothetical protein MLD52_02645 [Puniceicoccaceae bacterium K14]|nr:hypothetical protein [Puniceicoccaceae bacterium K14]
MRNSFLNFLLITFTITLSVKGAILSPDKRIQNIGTAESITSLRVVVVDSEEVEKIGNPFSLDRFPEPEVEEFVTERLPAGEVLAVLSPYVVPTGVFLVNEEYIAMFQGKQVRNGDLLNVVYEGEEYDLVISEIDRTSFTMKYEESTLKVKLK